MSVDRRSGTSASHGGAGDGIDGAISSLKIVLLVLASGLVVAPVVVVQFAFVATPELIAYGVAVVGWLVAWFVGPVLVRRRLSGSR